MWFDSLVYTPTAISHLIDQVCISRMVLGTDYPFDMGSYDVHRLRADIPELSESGRAALLGGNALCLIGGSA
jgi:aminocarboxymuconate-semialdehyde decarboxylase